MIIKKISLFCAMAAMSVALSSCLGEPEDLRTYTINVSNMIVPDDVAEPVTFDLNCSYNLRIDGVKNTLTVGTTNLSLGGSDLSFTTNSMDCLDIVAPGGMSGTFARGEAHLSNGQQVSRLNGFYTSSIYAVEVIGEPFKFYVSNPMLVINYRVGNSTVKTFSMNPFFKGTTTTTYPMQGEDKTYNNGDATYRVNFAQDMKSANVVIYNIKFAQEMPRALQAVVLKDVPVTVNHDGYVLQAANVVPEVLEGGELTPYPSFTFTSFMLKSASSDLTVAECEYVVNGVFKGSFYGSYCSHYTVSGE